MFEVRPYHKPICFVDATLFSFILNLCVRFKLLSGVKTDLCIIFFLFDGACGDIPKTMYSLAAKGLK